MASQPAAKSTITTTSESSDEESYDDLPKNFKWTTKYEKSLLFNMIRLKPAGINKHLSVLLLREKMSKHLKVKMTSKLIWQYLSTKWDIPTADMIEGCNFDLSEVDFSLPEEYDQLIAEETEKIKKLHEKERLDHEMKKKKLSGPGKTRSKSNSMSSVDSKDGVNENVQSVPPNNYSVKTIEVGLDEVSSSRRSLRTNDKIEDKELETDLPNKKKLPKDVKQLSKTTPAQLKETKVPEKMFNIKGVKRKNRNVSESSLSSDNSKQPRNNRSNLTSITASDSSSRSVTPEIHRNKTSNRSVTPEKITRKSNLRSGDKNHKNKSATEKTGQKYDIIMPEIKIERYKPEKGEKQATSASSKHTTPNKNEASNTIKTRRRLGPDLSLSMQAKQQLLDSSPSISRRSCSNKN